MRYRLLGLGVPFLLICGFAVADRPITIFLVGDSTAAPKLVGKRPETGWGEKLQQYFDADRVRVDNRARNGRSTRSFIAEGRWQSVVEDLRPGDYVFVQLAHNDEPKGGTNPNFTPPAEFRTNLVRYVTEARTKGANPVLLTPVMRRRFNEAGAFYDTHEEYPEIVRSVATELGVPLVDVHRRSEAVLREYGPERSKTLFLHLAPGDHPNYPRGLSDDTHFSPIGAEVMAQEVVAGIREAVPALAVLLSGSGAPTAGATPLSGP